VTPNPVLSAELARVCDLHIFCRVERGTPDIRVNFFSLQRADGYARVFTGDLPLDRVRNMVPTADPKVDYAFKKIFGSESNGAVLLNLLQAVLNPPADRPLVAVEIRNPFNDKQALNDKLSILDIKARDRRGQQCNIEMQMVVPREFPQRVLYYWAILHSQQLREGTVYKALQPTISISFVNGVLFPQVTDFHLDFQLRSSRHSELIFSVQQSIHLVELPKFKKTATELVTPLEVWCYFLVHGAALDVNTLPEAMRGGALRRAMEVRKMLTQDEQERERYESRLKAQRDLYSITDAARDEGREQGLEQGIQQGEVLGRIHSCQRLLKLPLTPREELLGLPVAELHARAAALEQQLDASAPSR
jgi:predicted transposase/invertase (TIGR01784 family)